jgi:hypothetical protein
MWVERNLSACDICTEKATIKDLYIKMFFTEYRKKYLYHWCYKTLSIHFRSQLCIDGCLFNNDPVFDDGVYVLIHDYLNIKESEPHIQKVDKTVRPLFFKYRNNMIDRAKNINYYKERINVLILSHRENTYFKMFPNDIIYVLNYYLRLLYLL